MSSVEAAKPGVEGAHTVFFVTNFWEHMSAAKEIEQGKAVTDASKAAGVKHLIFSSLINVTKATNGRLPHVSHFDGKADIEDYIRGSGVPATFVMPGFFMSNFFSAIQRGDDGSYTLSLPVVGDKAQVPAFDAAADTGKCSSTCDYHSISNFYVPGKFVKAAIKHFPKHSGKQILAATNYYTPEQLVTEFSEVMGKPAKFAKISEDTYKSFLPEPIAQEMLENMLLLEEPGYYAGADLKESLGLLDEKPTTWKAFVEKNKAKWA